MIVRLHPARSSSPAGLHDAERHPQRPPVRARHTQDIQPKPATYQGPAATNRRNVVRPLPWEPGAVGAIGRPCHTVAHSACHRPRTERVVVLPGFPEIARIIPTSTAPFHRPGWVYEPPRVLRRLRYVSTAT